MKKKKKGRPRRSPEPERTKVEVVLTPAEKKEALRLANGIPLSRYFRQAVLGKLAA
jgi:hypothetical protein